MTTQEQKDSLDAADKLFGLVGRKLGEMLRTGQGSISNIVATVTEAQQLVRDVSNALTSAPPPATLVRLVTEWQAAMRHARDSQDPDRFARLNRAIDDLETWTPGGAETPRQTEQVTHYTEDGYRVRAVIGLPARNYLPPADCPLCAAPSDPGAKL